MEQGEPEYPIPEIVTPQEHAYIGRSDLESERKETESAELWKGERNVKREETFQKLKYEPTEAPKTRRDLPQ